MLMFMFKYKKLYSRQFSNHQPPLCRCSLPHLQNQNSYISSVVEQIHDTRCVFLVSFEVYRTFKQVFRFYIADWNLKLKLPALPCKKHMFTTIASVDPKSLFLVSEGVLVCASIKAFANLQGKFSRWVYFYCSSLVSVVAPWSFEFGDCEAF